MRRTLRGVGLIATLAALVIPGASPAQGTSTPIPPIDFSALIFGNYQYHTEPGAANNSNKFDLDRAYLTFRSALNEHVSARVTLDISPQQNGTGYVWRDKYAYIQYDFGAVGRGFRALVRGGVLHTVVIDHEEGFWPRWLGTVPIERFGFGSSADVGISSLITLPSSSGEVYAAITNGAGYSRPEQDRFKSFAARATWTPFGSRQGGLLKSLALSGWGDRNAAASNFVSGGAGQVGSVGDGLHRDRFGVFVGIRDPRLVLGVETSGRTDGQESGLNTAASPRIVRDVEASLTSAYAIVRPFQLADSASKSKLSLVARVDQYTPDKSLSARAGFIDFGVIFDLTTNRRAQLGFDYQAQTTDPSVTGIATTRVYAARFVMSF